MFYHASPVEGITVLEPRLSQHGMPLVYFSLKRENVLVYLSNAVEKFCRETGFAWEGKYRKWGPYGFTGDGRQHIDEYYPGALEETYRGVSGYIYRAEEIHPAPLDLQIRDAAASDEPVRVSGWEFVPDALEAILQAEREGRIVIRRYGELTEQEHQWIWRTIPREYESAADHPEYRHFLKAKFPFLEETDNA